MLKIMLAIILVLAIIYIVPFLVYGLATIVTDLKPPEDVSPARLHLPPLSRPRNGKFKMDY